LKRKMADRKRLRHMERRDEERRKDERRTQERRKEQLPFERPERRLRGKDRRQYVRRVITGEIPLPHEESRG
jgi:hypothetical protein